MKFENYSPKINKNDPIHFMIIYLIVLILMHLNEVNAYIKLSWY